ncbi:ribonuclease H1 isoform X1 [Anopheles coustani]|uniref:ribonuclease H1 isoform X1 n=1 Tax=Anopheles coustani TaxID=139045 RepID=UPI002657C513|nr:ribonuclease H1 isoform X1 [Anopheles coustani]
MLFLWQSLDRILKMPFYAVAKGRQVGIYNTWPECQQQVNGFTGARFKKFATESEANNFVQQNSGGSSAVSSTNWGRGSTVGKRSFTTGADTTQPVKKQFKKTILLDEAPKPVSKMVKYGLHYFSQDDDGFVHVYTDGSCEGNGQAHAAAGLGVYFGEGHALNTAQPVSGRATNNCGEIQAASMAIRLARAQGVRRLMVNTDSQFLINSITKWLPGWKRRNWTLASGGEVKNKTDFQELERELSSGDIEIKWNHVDAHCGIAGNERADELARQGTQMYRTMRRGR